ncbi:RING-H2 finger protein ATL74-like [Humulus lupulus]|uniref:RING-H2 finger protein ATL74-like n=1 Tax=Humulus lupulus TaxID=3486 RepID=UPI002B404B9D|nr:RING-H2 finger protein ATL74-like [Humulus lupulus]
MSRPTIMTVHRRLLDAALTVPTPATSSAYNGNRTRDSFISESNFDTNMVIILAALLCALICALGLNSIVRCALRCSQRFATETPEQAAARLSRTGLKKSRLRQIPVAVYGSGTEIPATECPICLGEFKDGEKVRVLPKCNHGFHVRCIDTWLLSHSSCPNCRHSLLEQKQTTSSVPDSTPEEVNEREDESPGNESQGCPDNRRDEGSAENGREESSPVNGRKESPANGSGREDSVVITVHETS